MKRVDDHFRAFAGLHEEHHVEADEDVLRHASEGEDLDVHAEIIEGDVLGAADVHEVEAEPALPDGVAAGRVDAHPEQLAPAPLLAPTSDVSVVLPNGHKITWYHSQIIFEAPCGSKGLHGARCRRTKSSAPAKGMREVLVPQQGRPLGNILAWLEHAARYGNAAEHQMYEPTLVEREQARNDFSRGDHPLAAVLLSCERPQRPGEGAEPIVCP